MTQVLERPSQPEREPLHPSPLGVAESMATATDELATRLRASLVAVRSHAGGGAGTAWRSDGLIVTNNHVVPGDEAEVLLPDGRALPARIVARDPGHDLAALRVEAVLTPVAVGDSSKLRAGEMVFAIGNPWGIRGSVTAGIVFGVGPAMEDAVPVANVIRADIQLAPGNSGGPLADSRGRVVGINSMVAGGMGVAIPSNTIADFVASYLAGE
ncbi:MAG TPA: trypsin-like peptidase domain-containing protein [Tepidiformaceae bacterium]|nr:trypsin-like peptidase domain-containing protein [Tepidiformaceae bacterium]